MEDRLASQNATLKRQRISEDRNSPTSYRVTSIEANGSPRTGSDPANRYRSDAEDHTYHDAIDYARGRVKRQRPSLLSDEADEEVNSSQTRVSSEELLPSTTRGVPRCSFDAYRRQSSRSITPAPVATIPSADAMSVRFGPGFQNPVASDAPEPSPGMQAKPIELSDYLSSGTDDDENDKAEDFPPGQLLIQGLPESGNLTQSGQETQLSLSTSAFESQGSNHPIVGGDTGKIQHRKEAYKAVRELSGDWEVEHSLVSSRTSHYEEEIEL